MRSARILSIYIFPLFSFEIYYFILLLLFDRLQKDELRLSSGIFAVLESIPIPIIVDQVFDGRSHTLLRSNGVMVVIFALGRFPRLEMAI